MSTKQKYIPLLRFPEFKGDWESDIMKSICKINQGLQIAIADRLKEQEEGAYFYITNEFLKENSKSSYYIKNPPQSVLCTEDDILMTRTGNTGQVVTNVSGAFHNNFFKIDYNRELVVKSFLYQYLITRKVQNKILSLAGTSTIPDLNHGDFYKLPVYLPVKPEQQKIADFLTSVDERIQKLSRKKELLEQYKKGVMQQIFSQQIRFKDDNSNNYPGWEEKKLGEVSDVRDGTHESPKYIEDGYMLITSKNLLKDGTMDFSNVSYISKKDFEAINKRSKVDKGDILFGMIGTIGNPVLVKDVGYAIKNVALIKQGEELLNRYLIHYLHSESIGRQFYTQNLGGTQKFLSLTSIRSLLVELPSIIEQQKIADFLSNIDDKIAIVNAELEHCQNFKKGLLQQMFV